MTDGYMYPSELEAAVAELRARVERLERLLVVLAEAEARRLDEDVRGRVDALERRAAA